MGWCNQKVQCCLGPVWLGSSIAERNLGVLVGHNWNVSQQCTTAATRASQFLRCICTGIASRDRAVLLFSVLVRLQLDRENRRHANP